MGACSHDKLSGGGAIYVDRPEVFTRERLLNRRLAEQTWLNEHLKKEPDPGFQGSRDVREFEAFLGKVQANFNPAAGVLESARTAGTLAEQSNANELAAIRAEMDLVRARDQLERLKKAVEAGADPPAAPQGGSASELEAKVKNLEAQIAELKNAPRKPAAPEHRFGADFDKLPGVPEPKARNNEADLSSVEQFRDKLAYRDSVHAVLRERELDDTHDLKGLTLYTLKFDISVRPDPNTNRVGLVQCELIDGAEKDKLDLFIDGERPRTKEALDKYRKFGGWDHLLNERYGELFDEWLGVLDGRVATEALAFQKRMIETPERLTQQEWIEIARAQDQTEGRLWAALSNVANLLGGAPGVRSDSVVSTPSPFAWDQEPPSSVDLKGLYERIVVRLDARAVDGGALPDDLRRDLKALQEHWDKVGAPRVKRLGPEVEAVSDPGDPKQWLRDAIESDTMLRAYATWKQLGDPATEEDALAKAAAWVVADRFERRLAGIVEFRELRAREIESKKRYLPRVRVTDPGQQFVVRGEEPVRTLSGFERFAQRLETAAAGYVYSVEPKELSQNISDVAASERLTSLLASVGAVIPGGDVQAAAESLRRSQELVQGILRRPLVVGFAQGERTFGWLLGPRFKGAVGGQQFEQATVQHSVQATLALRGWANKATFEITTGWIDTGSVTPSASEPGNGPRTVTVTLPTDLEALTNLLMSDTSTLPRKPIVDVPGRTADQAPFTVVGDESADLVLRGYELWRNPEVYIGSQRADEVRVMPDMRGIVATFRRVRPVPVGPKGVAEVDLLVVTSGGDTREPRAVSVLPPRRSTIVANVDQFASIQRTPAIMGRPLTIELSPALIPPGFAGQRLVLRALTGIAGASEPVEWNSVPALADRPTSLTLPALSVKNLATSQLAELLQANKPGAKFDAALQVQLVSNGDWIDVTKSDARTLYIFPDASHKLLTLASTEIWLSGTQPPAVSLKLAEHVLAAYPALQSAILSTEPRLMLTYNNEQPISLPIGGGLQGDVWKVDPGVFTAQMIDSLLPEPAAGETVSREYAVKVTGLPADFSVTPAKLTFKRSKPK